MLDVLRNFTGSGTFVGGYIWNHAWSFRWLRIVEIVLQRENYRRSGTRILHRSVENRINWLTMWTREFITTSKSGSYLIFFLMFNSIVLWGFVARNVSSDLGTVVSVIVADCRDSVAKRKLGRLWDMHFTSFGRDSQKLIDNSWIYDWFYIQLITDILINS